MTLDLFKNNHGKLRAKGSEVYLSPGEMPTEKDLISSCEGYEPTHRLCDLDFRGNEEVEETHRRCVEYLYSIEGF